ncbi:hypothetical protein BDK51DRAFT_30556 [Blyttiomyces helicus]|uniref:Uncharacterized protein n=1 Tax=Blyttiomyces helicus TaxID=388810 RepID=A0A4P9W9I1_9FUNG|nr:hypothetical protein BDK51DRAFT_30556 [Blyttiomyces helicus]|eukprot:RKO87778.1 hypothetical protein BDK51DRAFT_30556 [Blyttiomyces helicus]
MCLRKLDFLQTPAGRREQGANRSPLEGRELSPEDVARNPNAAVLVFSVDDSTTLTHSTAKMEYLEGVDTSTRVPPKDPISRAHNLAIIGQIPCDVHPTNNLRVLKCAGNIRRENWATSSTLG